MKQSKDKKEPSIIFIIPKCQTELLGFEGDASSPQEKAAKLPIRLVSFAGFTPPNYRITIIDEVAVFL